MNLLLMNRLENMTTLSDVNEIGESRSLQFIETNDGDDSDYSEEIEFVNEHQQQAQTRGGGTGGRGRGRPRRTSPPQAAQFLSSQKKRKAKGNKYISVASRKLKFLLNNISSFKAQNISDEDIMRSTTNEIKKLGNMEVHNLHGQLLKVNEDDSKDVIATEAFSLIALNEPHIHQMVEECSVLDSHALKTRLSDIQKKIITLEEKLRCFQECEALLNHYLYKLQNSAYAMKLLTKCLYSVLNERICNV